MKIYLNTGNNKISDLKSGAVQLPTACFSQRFHQVMNYNVYLGNNQEKFKEWTPEIAGNFSSLLIGISWARSHFDNGSDTIAELTLTLQEKVNGSWVDRTEAKVRNTDYVDYQNDGESYNFQNTIKVDFPPYPITTDAGKWRVKFKNKRIQGTDAGYVYIWRLFSSGSFSPLTKFSSKRTVNVSPGLISKTKSMSQPNIFTISIIIWSDNCAFFPAR